MPDHIFSVLDLLNRMNILWITIIFCVLLLLFKTINHSSRLTTTAWVIFDSYCCTHVVSIKKDLRPYKGLKPFSKHCKRYVI